MKRTCAAILVVVLSTGAGAQDKKDGDKIGKDKAPVVLKKALAEIQKKKCASIKESAELSAGPQRVPPSTFEGILRKDFSAVKGSAEVYAKGATYLVNLGGRFDPPDDLQGQDAMGAQSYRNPSILLDEVGKLASPPQFGPDEMVEGKDCKTVDIATDPAMLKQHLKEFGDRLNKAMKGMIGFGGAQVFDMKNAMDEKNTASSYHVCIGKEDLLIYRIDFVIRPKMKPGALPAQIPLPQDMMQKIDVHFSKWDEDAPFDIPGLIKTKWGIK
ncbi:MAG: hypothetical protein HY293_19255 [Planctomycetes bacterium]|nr:hypothetical protein [Planctomycetota bacterium]